MYEKTLIMSVHINSKTNLVCCLVSRQMHYPPESTSIMLLVRILAFIEQSADPSAAAATFKQFCHRTVNEDAELVHKLLGEQFGDQLNTLRELTANVISGDHVQEVCHFTGIFLILDNKMHVAFK